MRRTKSKSVVAGTFSFSFGGDGGVGRELGLFALPSQFQRPRSNLIFSLLSSVFSYGLNIASLLSCIFLA